MGEKKKPRVNMTMRLRVLTALFLVIGFGLVGVRLLYMQVFHHDFYIQKATSLQTRDTFITPNRGKIYDANMQVLAESAEVERITVSPKAVVSETKEKNGVTADVQRQTLATILSETLDVSYDSVMEKLNKTDSEYEIIAQKVDKDVTKELNAKLEAAGCTGVYSEPDTKRYYQHGSFLSAVLGYVGSDNNGAYGIESQYNDELSGTAGRIVRVQNAQNEDIVPDTQQYIPAKDGNSLVLTIDSDIQNYLEKHLETAFADNPEARDGVSGIVMNIKTGEVLAMANLPDFDPNDAYHLTSEVYINELKTDVQKILTDAKIAAVIPDKWYEEGGLANLPEELQKNDDIVSKLGSRQHPHEDLAQPGRFRQLRAGLHFQAHDRRYGLRAGRGERGQLVLLRRLADGRRLEGADQLREHERPRHADADRGADEFVQRRDDADRPEGRHGAVL